jgi:hypothetical protein
LNQQNPKGATTTQDFSFLSEASPIYVTSLSNNNSTVTSAAVTQARINAVPPAKSPTVKSFSNPIVDQFGNSSTNYIQHHPELHQTNSTSNQVLTTSIIRKPITSSSTFDNKSLSSASLQQHQIIGGSSSSTQIVTQQQQQLTTAIPLYDPSSDLIKSIASNNNLVNNNNNINFHNNINALNNNAIGGLDETSIGCTSYYSNNRTNEVR